MELAMASAIAILTATGVYLLLRARSFDVIIGLTLLSYATNLLIFSGGDWWRASRRCCATAWPRPWPTTPTRCRRPWS